MKVPITVALPCCINETVKVTGRKSKQRERPRNHQCARCHRQYTVDCRSGSPIVKAI